MIIDLTGRNEVLAAACRQVDIDAHTRLITRTLLTGWSVNGSLPRPPLDEDRIFIPSKGDCCITNPSMLVTERTDYKRKENGKYRY